MHFGFVHLSMNFGFNGEDVREKVYEYVVSRRSTPDRTSLE